MNDNRFQHLAEDFNSIISMMLASLRARGLRGLLDLPKTILLGLYLRRLGREFAAIIASLDLSNLPHPTPAPPDQLLPPQSDPAPRARPRLAANPRAYRPRTPAAARPIPTAPNPPNRIPQTTRHHPRIHPRPHPLVAIPATARTP